MPTIATSVVNIYNFQIDTQCPQCGAPVVLGETDHIIGCDFCRTRHILHAHPFPCYFVEPRQSKFAHLEHVYIPYWRFKGLEFKLEAREPGFRVIDHSYLAVKTHGLPASLGLRSQTQRLQFVKKDMEGTFQPPDLSHQDLLKQIAGNTVKRIHIGEILSLIFMPFYKDGETFIDGLSGAKVPCQIPDQQTKKKAPAIALKFTPGLCPNCGWDLTGETDSLILNCHNCHSVWLIHSKQLKKISTRQESAPTPGDRLLPFWTFGIKLENLDCTRYAHLMKMANLPRVIQASHKEQPLYFYIPAFKINPKLFLRIGKQTTIAQIESCKTDTLPKTEYHPADLPLEEGFQAILPLIMAICANKKETWSQLKQEKLELTSFCLTYLSFRKSGSEFIQESMGTSIPVNSLKFGRGI